MAASEEGSLNPEVKFKRGSWGVWRAGSQIRRIVDMPEEQGGPVVREKRQTDLRV